MAYNSNDIPKHAGVVIDKAAAVRIATSIGWEPKRTWVGLSDDEIQRVIDVTPDQFPDYMMRFAWNLQQQLKEKNT